MEPIAAPSEVHEHRCPSCGTFYTCTGPCDGYLFEAGVKCPSCTEENEKMPWNLDEEKLLEKQIEDGHISDYQRLLREVWWEKHKRAVAVLVGVALFTLVGAMIGYALFHRGNLP